MSRFFRSGDSSSSSEDEDEGHEIEHNNTAVSAIHADEADIDSSSGTSALSIAEQNQPGMLNQASQQWTSHHKDVLLHALLENWGLSETLKYNEGASSDSPGIQAEARARYHALVSQLAPFNVLPASLGADQHAVTRQRYRDVLSVLGQPHSQQSDIAVPSSARRLLTDGSVDAAHSLSSLASDQLPRGALHNQWSVQAPLRHLLGHTDQEHSHNSWSSEIAAPPPLGLMQHGMGPGYGQSRYHSDFEELRMLGKGGYGIVYQARNRLDNQAYAVKKVPLSMARLHRIRTRGEAEVKEILRELQTLARFNHPNIVRYHSTWVEWTEAPSNGAAFTSSHDDVSTMEDSTAGADDSPTTPLHRVITEEEVDDLDVVFEHSGITELPESADSGSAPDDHGPATRQLRRTGTRSTIATASDETAEPIDRDLDVSASIRSTADGAHFAQSTLAIHIQMALHPMTLADLLADQGGDQDSLQHCYHLEPSAGIATAVLEGIEYLHDENVIHRDIKPANIFLSPTKRRGPRDNCVDLRQCSDCNHSQNGSGIQLQVCIGDFGLAAVASPDETESQYASSPVGTAIYRPTTAEAKSRNLDIYALGVVLFELLWKFETRMERHHIIHELKEGRYPDGFCERIGRDRGVKAMDCVDCMLAHHAQAATISEVKEKLGALVAREDTYK